MISRSSGPTWTPLPSGWPRADISSTSNSSGRWIPSAAPRSRGRAAEGARATPRARDPQARKQGKDISAIQQESPGDRAIKIAALDEKAKSRRRSFSRFDGGRSEYSARIRAGGQERGRQCRSPALGPASPVRFRAQGALGSGPGAEDPGSGARHQNHRRAVCRLLGHRRASGARAHQLFSGRSHARARIYRSAAAVSDQLGQLVRHRPASQVQGRSV